MVKNLGRVQKCVHHIYELFRVVCLYFHILTHNVSPNRSQKSLDYDVCSFPNINKRSYYWFFLLMAITIIWSMNEFLFSSKALKIILKLIFLNLIGLSLLNWFTQIYSLNIKSHFPLSNLTFMDLFLIPNGLSIWIWLIC